MVKSFQRRIDDVYVVLPNGERDIGAGSILSDDDIDFINMRLLDCEQLLKKQLADIKSVRDAIPREIDFIKLRRIEMLYLIMFNKDMIIHYRLVPQRRLMLDGMPLFDSFYLCQQEVVPLVDAKSMHSVSPESILDLIVEQRGHQTPTEDFTRRVNKELGLLTKPQMEAINRLIDIREDCRGKQARSFQEVYAKALLNCSRNKFFSDAAEIREGVLESAIYAAESACAEKFSKEMSREQFAKAVSSLRPPMTVNLAPEALYDTYKSKCASRNR